MLNNFIVVGFSIFGYNPKVIKKLTDRQKHELALSDDEYAVIYDNVNDFFNDLNDKVVDINMRFYIVQTN